MDIPEKCIHCVHHSEIQDNYPHSPVLIDTEKISDVLETAFLEAGLLKVNKKTDKRDFRI